MSFCTDYQYKCILCGSIDYSNIPNKEPHICYFCSRGRNETLLDKIKEQYKRNLELSQKYPSVNIEEINIKKGVK